MKDATETELVEATIEQDRDAYSVLVGRYAADLFATCLGMVSNVDDAKDIAQETFMRGFTRIGQLKSNDKFRPWIMGIARNLCRDHLRRKKRRAAHARSCTEAAYEMPDEYRDIHEAIARLREEYRMPLLLYYFDGRSSESVAEALNISRDGVLTRLSRARRELRKLMTSGEER